MDMRLYGLSAPAIASSLVWAMSRLFSQIAPLTCLSFSFIKMEALTCMKEGHARLQPGEIRLTFLAREAALGDLHPVILVDEDCNVLDVGLESLVPTQDERLGHLESSSLVLVLMLNNNRRPFVRAGLVDIGLHHPFV